jgi:hypothetical protein
MAAGEAPISNIPQQLANLAVEGGATDNVTSLAVMLKGPPTENVMMAVFDGHMINGAEAAQKAAGYLANAYPGVQAVRTNNLDVEGADMSSAAPTQPHQVVKPAAAQNTKGIMDYKWEPIVDREKRALMALDLKNVAPDDLAALKEKLYAEGLQWEARRSSMNGGTDTLAVAQQPFMNYMNRHYRALIAGTEWNQVEDRTGRGVCIVDVKAIGPEKLSQLKDALAGAGLAFEERHSSYKGGMEVLSVGQIDLAPFLKAKNEPRDPDWSRARVYLRPPRKPGF